MRSIEHAAWADRRPPSAAHRRDSAPLSHADDSVPHSLFSHKNAVNLTCNSHSAAPGALELQLRGATDGVVRVDLLSFVSFDLVPP